MLSIFRHQPLCRLQLIFVVDPKYFLFLVTNVSPYLFTFFLEYLYHIRYVILSLDVSPVNPGERGKKILAFEAKDTAVDLTDLALDAGCITVLDYPDKLAVTISYYPAVAARIIENRGKDRGRSLLPAVKPDKAYESTRAEEGNITIVPSKPSRRGSDICVACPVPSLSDWMTNSRPSPPSSDFTSSA
jgi:hypothetical protein